MLQITLKSVYVVFPFLLNFGWGIAPAMSQKGESWNLSWLEFHALSMSLKWKWSAQGCHPGICKEEKKRWGDEQSDQ